MQCYNTVTRPGFYSLRQGVATAQAGLELLILLLLPLKVLSLHTRTTKAGKITLFLTTSDYDSLTGDLAVEEKLDFLSVTTWEAWVSIDNHSWEPFAVLIKSSATASARTLSICSDLLWTKSPLSLALRSTALGSLTLPLLQGWSPWRPVLRVSASDMGLLRSWFLLLLRHSKLSMEGLSPHPGIAHLWLQVRNLNLTKLQGQDPILNPGNRILRMQGPGALGAGIVAQWKITCPRLGILRVLGSIPSIA